MRRTWSAQRRRRQLPLRLCLRRAASLGQAQPVSEDEEPKPACLAIGTEIESLCGSEYQRCQFLADVCVTSHPSLVPHMDRGVLEMYARIVNVKWKQTLTHVGFDLFTSQSAIPLLYLFWL